MRGLDADVGALRERRRGKIRVEREMRAVRLVHNQRHAVLVRCTRQRRHIAAHAVVRGAHLRAWRTRARLGAAPHPTKIGCTPRRMHAPCILPLLAGWQA